MQETWREGWPLVSVIVPTRDRPEQLVEALVSLEAQTFEDFEVIVVNDAGCDVRERLIPFEQTLRLTYVTLLASLGAAGTRNRGLEKARGKYVCYLDDDDRFYPHHLETLAHRLEESGGAVVYTDAVRADKVLEEGKLVTRETSVPYAGDFESERLLLTNFLPILCPMHRRDCLAEIGGFDESFAVLEDWEFWLRLSRHYAFEHLSQTTCEFTWRLDGRTLTHDRRRDFAAARDAVYRKHRGLYDALPHLQARWREMWGYLPDGETDGFFDDYGKVFPEVLTLIRPYHHRFLDLTCGFGMVGLSLGGQEARQADPERVLFGLQHHEPSARQAVAFYDQVFPLLPERMDELGFEPGSFDCLVLNPFLLPSCDLEAILRKAERLLHEQGCLILCLGNPNHGDALPDEPEAAEAALFAENLGFREATYSGLEAWLSSRGWGIDEASAYREPLSPERQAGLRSRLAARRLPFEDLLPDLEARRFAFRLSKRVPVSAPEAPLHPEITEWASQFSAPLVSIVLPISEGSEPTRLCVTGILSRSTVPFELILVDDGSTDGTQGFLTELATASDSVRVIRNSEARGFAYACNQGIALARGEVVVLLSSDVVVSEGWLEGLLKPLLADERVGIVGPMANRASGMQLISYAPYLRGGFDEREFLRFARRFALSHEGRWVWGSRLDTFCLAIRREVFESLGGFEPSFGAEDGTREAFCLRLQRAGYKAWVTEEVFVHRQGSPELASEGTSLARWGSSPGLAAQQRAWQELADSGLSESDTLPVLVESVPGFSLGSIGEQSFLLLPDWGDTVSTAAIISEFCKSYSAWADVSLLIWRDPLKGPAQAEAETFVLAALPPDSPDVMLFDELVTPRTVSRLYRSAKFLLDTGAGSGAAEAERCGVAVIGREELRTHLVADARRGEGGKYRPEGYGKVTEHSFRDDRSS